MEIPEILSLVIKWAVPTVLATFVGKVTYMRKSNNDMKKSMVLLLRSQIVGKCENYISLGYLPSYARSCIADLFEEYTALGGNHGVGSLVEQCYDLPPMKESNK